MQPQRRYFDANGVRYSYLVWGESAKKAEPSQPGRSDDDIAQLRSRSLQPALARLRSARPRTEPSQSAGLPPVLLVHGFAQSAETWQNVAQILAEDRTVYALDLVGHGRSDKPSKEIFYCLPEMGRALLAFSERLPAPPLLVGYSLGGRVVLSALVEAGSETFARCASGLVLESAGLGMPTEQDRAAAAERDAATVRRLHEQPLSEFMTNWANLPLFASQKSLPREVREAIRAGRLANDPVALAHSVAQAGQHAMPARSDILAALRQLAAQAPCPPVTPAPTSAAPAAQAPAAPAAQAPSAPFPILYLAGQLDGKYAAMAAELARATSNAVPVRLIPDVGHSVHLEAPEIFADCVRCNR